MAEHMTTKEKSLKTQIREKRQQILRRSNEILKKKLWVAETLAQIAVHEKDLLNMQLRLDELRNQV